MNARLKSAISLFLAGLVSSCASSVGTKESDQLPVRPRIDRDSLFQKGHRFYVERDYDSAAVYYRKSLEFDSTYQPPLAGLAQLHYERAMQIEDRASPIRTTELRNSLRYCLVLETHHQHGVDLYDRLTELSYALGEKDLFLNFVKKRIAEAPDDRQYFNLGLAYGQVGDYPNVITSQKEAIEKYRFSLYIGGFYRQLGNAYMELDRQQTAERTFSTGVQVVNTRLSDIEKTEGVYLEADINRLKDDKVAMLRALRKIYRIHDQKEKLREVEHQLEAHGE
jgi:tetratricopeptide (TPR) repeat protein